MNIQYDYNQQWQKRRLKTALLIDNTIIQEGLRNGYDADDIKNEVKKFSPYLKGITQESIAPYLNKFKFDKKLDTVKSGFSYSDTLKKYTNTVANLYIKNELEIADELLYQGYKNYEIQNVIKKHAPYFKDFNIKSQTAKYTDYVNKILEHFPTKDHDPKLKEVTDYYAKQVAVMKHKSSNGFINEYADGKIALDLYFNQNVPLQTIHKVYLNSANNFAKQPQYADNMTNHLQKIKQRYEQIDYFHKKTPATTEERYLLYSKQYRHYQNKKILNGKDEQQIVKRLLFEKVSKQEIRKALAVLSPIAIYPGRDTDKYINTTIEVVEREYAQLKEKAQEHYKHVSELFDKELRRVDELKQKDIANKKIQKDIFYYGILAKNLLNQNCYAQYIIDNFEKKLPKLKAKLPNNENNYVYAIVNGAQKAVENERAVKNFVSPYKFYEMELKDIQDKKIPLVDVFRSVIKERLNIYPNIALNLDRKFIDRDAVVKLLNRYPGIDKNDLVKAVEKASVYNKMPGVSMEYPLKIVEQAIEKFEEANKALEEEKTKKENIKNDFELYKDVAGAAIKDSQENQKEYCDCKAAVSMINKKVNEIDIKNILAEEAEGKDLNEKYKYADYIYEKAQKIIAREIQIINHIPNKASIEDIYKTYMKDIYLSRKYFSTELDVNTAKKMLSDGIKHEDIAITLIKHSPICAEPNRGKDYIENYVLKKAQMELENEKEKIKNYQPKIREETDISKAYQQHYQDFINVIDLPYSKVADTIIATAMLLQKFSQDEIENTLTEQSPLSPKDTTNLKNNTYGKEIMANVKELNKSQERSNELIRQREITKEEKQL